MHSDTIIIVIKRKGLKFLIEQALNLSLSLDIDQFLDLNRFLDLDQFLDLNQFLNLSLDTYLEQKQDLKKVYVMQVT